MPIADPVERDELAPGAPVKENIFRPKAVLRTACLLTLFLANTARANPALEGYANYEALAKQVAELDKSDLITATSLGKTLGGREIHLLTIGNGKPEDKPAILIVGNVHAPHLAGGELALRTAKQLVEKAAADEKVKKLLNRCTIYVIPNPSPDASEKCFAKPFREPAGNANQTDDDRDFENGEDPPDDLNGDGWITMMRVADDSGEFFPHPDDPRVLIKADPKQNERGKYRLYTEGKDNDADGEFNEDAGDGVGFNRNFTFKYPYFERNAGANAVSEIETRAVAEFCYGHPNIALVFMFTPEDNLWHTWKPDGQAEQQRIKTRILGADAPYQEFVAADYRKLHGGKDTPGSPEGHGSFSEWGYYHYGRWSLAARGWWIPQVPPAPAAEGEKKPSGEKRGADDINHLRWLAQQGIDGFVDWKPVEHPDFPGKVVEVGGFKPFYSLNPPAKELDALAARHAEFITGLPEFLPRVEFKETKIESLGGGLFRVTAKTVNQGYLPTMAEMGRVNNAAHPLQISLDLPKGTEFLKGSPRSRLGRLEGNGNTSETVWLVRLSDAAPAMGKFKVWAPAVGSHEVQAEFKR